MALITLFVGIFVGFFITNMEYRHIRNDRQKYHALYKEQRDYAKKLLEANDTLDASRNSWRDTACNAACERNRLREEKQNLLDGISARELKIVAHEREIMNLRAKLSKLHERKGRENHR